MSGIPINNGFDNFSPRLLDSRQGKIVDGKSVPYDSVVEALASPQLNPAFRCVGLEVFIISDGIQKTFHFVGGTADVNLIEKTTASGPPTGTAGGDLSGTYPNPGVNKILGRSLSSVPPTNGQVLVYNSGTGVWEPGTVAGGSGGIIYDTIAAMRSAATPSGATTPYELKGYHAANDGGGGRTFMWDAASTATDNGGTVIKPTAIASNAPGRYLQILNGEDIQAAWFGATGDLQNITVDFNSATGKITKKVAQAINVTGGEGPGTPGTYRYWGNNGSGVRLNGIEIYGPISVTFVPGDMVEQFRGGVWVRLGLYTSSYTGGPGDPGPYILYITPNENNFADDGQYHLTRVTKLVDSTFTAFDIDRILVIEKARLWTAFNTLPVALNCRITSIDGAGLATVVNIDTARGVFQSVTAPAIVNGAAVSNAVIFREGTDSIQLAVGYCESKNFKPPILPVGEVGCMPPVSAIWAATASFANFAPTKPGFWFRGNSGLRGQGKRKSFVSFHYAVTNLVGAFGTFPAERMYHIFQCYPFFCEPTANTSTVKIFSDFTVKFPADESIIQNYIMHRDYNIGGALTTPTRHAQKTYFNNVDMECPTRNVEIAQVQFGDIYTNDFQPTVNFTFIGVYSAATTYYMRDVYVKADGLYYTIMPASTGSQHPVGATWLTGSGVPSGGLGVNGNWYLDIASGGNTARRTYFKDGGALVDNGLTTEAIWQNDVVDYTTLEFDGCIMEGAGFEIKHAEIRGANPTKEAGKRFELRNGKMKGGVFPVYKRLTGSYELVGADNVVTIAEDWYSHYLMNIHADYSSRPNVFFTPIEIKQRVDVVVASIVVSGSNYNITLTAPWGGTTNANGKLWAAVDDYEHEMYIDIRDGAENTGGVSITNGSALVVVPISATGRTIEEMQWYVNKTIRLYSKIDYVIITSFVNARAAIVGTWNTTGSWGYGESHAFTTTCRGLAQTVGYIRIVSGGTGYATAPTVVFSGGGGTGAAATAVVSGGIVVGFTLTNAGTGYTSVPTVALTPTSGGTGASVVAVLSQLDLISNATFDFRGRGYTGHLMYNHTSLKTKWLNFTIEDAPNLVRISPDGSPFLGMFTSENSGITLVRGKYAMGSNTTAKQAYYQLSGRVNLKNAGVIDSSASYYGYIENTTLKAGGINGDSTIVNSRLESVKLQSGIIYTQGTSMIFCITYNGITLYVEKSPLAQMIIHGGKGEFKDSNVDMYLDIADTLDFLPNQEAILVLTNFMFRNCVMLRYSSVASLTTLALAYFRNNFRFIGSGVTATDTTQPILSPEGVVDFDYTTNDVVYPAVMNYDAGFTLSLPTSVLGIVPSAALTSPFVLPVSGRILFFDATRARVPVGATSIDDIRISNRIPNASADFSLFAQSRYADGTRVVLVPTVAGFSINENIRLSPYTTASRPVGVPIEMRYGRELNQWYEVDYTNN